MHSCIYEGQVRHRRYSPKQHKFSYRLFYVYLDLDELEHVFQKRWLWSANKPSVAWLKRSDYLGDQDIPLKQAVLDKVEHEKGVRPAGPVRLLTHLRYFGYVFNPVSFYYCFDKNDNHVETIVAEITNTPWGERHSYVLSLNKEMYKRTHMKFELDKEFHISPFMPMEMQYDWRFTQPLDLLAVHMNNFKGKEKVFDATLSLNKKPMNAMTCAKALIIFPLMTAKVIAGIYWQALRLFIKQVPFHSHPEDIGTATPSHTVGGTERENRI